MDTKLLIKAPGAPPLEYSVDETPVVLGRDPGVDIPVPSQYVSRRHVQLQSDGDRLLLTDLGGRNPIVVNGQPIAGSGFAHPGDTITIADVTIDVIGPDLVSTGTIVFSPTTTASMPPPPPPPRPGTGSIPTPPRSSQAPAGIQSVWQGQNLGPGGTLTIMFSDLEQSTSMVTELGEREAYRLINMHNQILREQFREYRGHEAKRMGDGFLVLFASARDALNCSISIQRRLAELDGEKAPIRVRIGLHIGEVLWDDNDIFGSAVNFAARVSAQAEGGEILISALLREVISVSGEFSFGEDRVVSLKGFKGTHHLTPLEWREIPV